MVSKTDQKIHHKANQMKKLKGKKAMHLKMSKSYLKKLRNKPRTSSKMAKMINHKIDIV